MRRLPGLNLPAWILPLRVGDLATNCFVLAADRASDAGAGERPASASPAAIIDPGGDPQAIQEALDLHHAAPELILLTHAHSDHWGALPALLRAYPACVVAASPTALEWLGDPALNLSTWGGRPASLRPPLQRALAGGDRISAGGVELTAIETAGHTPGCVAYFAAAGPVLFSGDALFRGSVGRTDLPGSSYPSLELSLRKLASLPPETLVLPGHGGCTTIGREVATNEYLRHASET